MNTMQKPVRSKPAASRKLLDMILAVAALELAFFLFRMGAGWWGR
jgi:hypothetical protein